VYQQLEQRGATGVEVWPIQSSFPWGAAHVSYNSRLGSYGGVSQATN
jgi:hypothetical protein